MRKPCLLVLALLGCFLSTPAKADIVTGLVGLWDFNTNVSPQPDSSGFNNNATPSGAVFFNDPTRGGVMSFDGNDDFLQAADSASLSITGDLTLSSWVNVVNFTAGTGYRGIIGKTVNNFPGPYDFYLVSAAEGGVAGRPRLYLGNGSAVGLANVDGLAAPSTGAWHLLTVTRSGNTVTHYLDGVFNGSGVIAPTVADGNGTLRIGNRADLFVDMLGSLDDVRIYNRALSSADVTELFLTTVPEPSSVLLLGVASLWAAVIWRRRIARRPLPPPAGA
jgi:hypothetical protein